MHARVRHVFDCTLLARMQDKAEEVRKIAFRIASLFPEHESLEYPDHIGLLVASQSVDTCVLGSDALWRLVAQHAGDPASALRKLQVHK